MLNKPAGILSTTSDERGRKTVIDILPAVYRDKGLYPAGRLDLDSTGLLILTNDGDLAYKLTHPRFEHEKEYYVYINGELTAAEKERLGKGIMLDDGMTYPAKVTRIKSSPPYNYSITIHEGRNRQVRRMFSELGHVIYALKRVRIGSLTLRNLEEGKSRELSVDDIKKLLYI
jgi:23S rRNA pseudouridine2605 synthase